LWLVVNEMHDSIRHEASSISEPKSELYGKPPGEPTSNLSVEASGKLPTSGRKERAGERSDEQANEQSAEQAVRSEE